MRMASSYDQEWGSASCLTISETFLHSVGFRCLLALVTIQVDGFGRSLMQELFMVSPGES